MGVRPCDDDRDVVVTVVALHLDIEFLGRIFFLQNFDTILGDILLALLHIFGCGVFQHFEAVFRLADQGAEGDGDGQSYHPRARNAYAHSVFQDIAR